MATTEGLSYLEGPPLTETEQGQFRPGWQHFLDSVSTFPDSPALASLHQPASLYPNIPNLPVDSPHLRWSYRNLKTAIDHLALSLRERHGLEPGMLVVTFLPNCAEYIVTKMAAHLTGAVLAPLNPRSLVNTEEINHILQLYTSHAPVKSGMVLVAEHEQVARQIDTLDPTHTTNAVKIIVGGSQPTSTWLKFADLMEEGERLDKNLSDSPVHYPYATDDTLFCTSGTTAQPKAILRTTAQGAYTIHALATQSGLSFSTARDRVLGVTPNNHVAGGEAVLISLCFGGTLIFPSARFDVDSFLQAAKLEHATYTILVPTMVVALSRSVRQSGMQGMCNLRSFFVGAAPVTRHVLAMCEDALGCKLAGPMFGSTEGALLRTGDRPLQYLLDASRDTEDVPTAWGLAAGQVIKVCEPGTGGLNAAKLVPFGVVGELHVSSPGLASGYIGTPESNGIAPSNPFYFDHDGRSWYNTGDQARLDPEGRLYVTGRYKDVIIRGGENISPAAVEAALEPTLGHLGVHIIGVPDDVAGEVPVAIAREPVDEDAKALVRETVVQRMGAAYIIDQVVSLAELRLDDFPRTALGKVQKSKLRDIVIDFLKQQGTVELQQHGEPESEEQHHLSRLWSQAVGIHDPERYLAPDTIVAELAVDSIVTMRVRDGIAKALNGRTLSLAEFSQVSTIREQAALLKSRSSRSVPNGQRKDNADRSGPPGPDGMLHVIENPSLFEPTKELVSAAMDKFGLTWDQHVSSVFPVYDPIAEVVITNSWFTKFHMRSVLGTKASTSKKQLRDAMVKVLSNNPMLLSFIVHDVAKLGHDLALHVLLELDDNRHSKFLDEHVFADGGNVASIQQVIDFAYNHPWYPANKEATSPGPLFTVWFFDVEETGNAACVWNASHLIIDATYNHILYDDIDHALTHPTLPLQPHESYQRWAESYYALRRSPAARAAVRHEAAIMEEIQQHAPEFIKSAPLLSEHEDTKSTLSIFRSFKVTGWANLRRQHPDLTLTGLLKAAFALVLMHRDKEKTGNKHTTVFVDLQANRSRWPFVPESQGDYPAADVAGETTQAHPVIISLVESESVIEYLHRLQVAQVLQTKHSSTPIIELGGVEDRNSLRSVRRVIEMDPTTLPVPAFNWVGPMQLGDTGSQYKAIELKDVAMNMARMMFMVFAGIELTAPDSLKSGGSYSIDAKEKVVGVGEPTMWFRLQNKPANMTQNEGEAVAKQLIALVQWFAKEENWRKGVRGAFEEALS